MCAWVDGDDFEGGVAVAAASLRVARRRVQLALEELGDPVCDARAVPAVARAADKDTDASRGLHPCSLYVELCEVGLDGNGAGS